MTPTDRSRVLWLTGAALAMTACGTVRAGNGTGGARPEADASGQTFSVSVPDNGELGCGPVPGPIARLRDLAPLAHG